MLVIPQAANMKRLLKTFSTGRTTSSEMLKITQGHNNESIGLQMLPALSVTME
jgi:hypothetical protein